MLAEPMPPGLADDIENGAVRLSSGPAGMREEGEGEREREKEGEIKRRAERKING